MRCMVCGTEMILMNVVQDDTMAVLGFEHHTFMCSECHYIDRRLVFTKHGRERLPALAAPIRIELKDYDVGIVHRVAQGPIELLLRRKSTDQVEVWPSLCPHEGGLMDERHLCDGQVVCPWHGRRFGPILLGRGARDSWRYLSVTVRHESGPSGNCPVLC